MATPTTPFNIANPEQFRTQFNKALNAASPWRLRGTICDVCKLHPAAISIVSDSLLVTEDQVPEQDDSDSDSDSDSGSEAGSEGSRSKVRLDISAPPDDDDDGILESQAREPQVEEEGAGAVCGVSELRGGV